MSWGLYYLRQDYWWPEIPKRILHWASVVSEVTCCLVTLLGSLPLWLVNNDVSCCAMGKCHRERETLNVLEGQGNVSTQCDNVWLQSGLQKTIFLPSSSLPPVTSICMCVCEWWWGLRWSSDVSDVKQRPPGPIFQMGESGFFSLKLAQGFKSWKVWVGLPKQRETLCHYSTNGRSAHGFVTLKLTDYERESVTEREIQNLTVLIVKNEGQLCLGICCENKNVLKILL